MRLSADVLTLAAALLLGALRLTVPTRPASQFTWALSYEAVAHLYVGGLVGAYLTTRRRFYLALAVSVTLCEVGLFLLLR